jgi:AAA family ATP:ADP antiporter
VPLYGVLFRRTARLQLLQWVTIFFIANLALFFVLGRAGVDIGFAYYVWVGVFSVMMMAQFWAHATHAFKVESGQRLFPLIMAGAALGGLVGPWATGALSSVLDTWELMLVAIALLIATLLFIERTWNAVPEGSRNGDHVGESKGHALGGFALVLKDRYLLLLAVLAVLLNCVNTTGEYILTKLALDIVHAEIAAQPGLDERALITALYGNYYFAANALGLVFQILLVTRIFRWVGVRGAILVLPIVALIGYGLVVFLPVFGIIRAVKILENSANYSIMNTVRHVLYLPLPAAHQYEGKTAVDTFFWRLGDVVQAGVIFLGVNWLGFEFQQFALLNMVLAVVWMIVAVRLGKRYPDSVSRPIRIKWSALAVGASTAAFAVAAFALPAKAAAERAGLFAAHEPIAIELSMNMRELCRGTPRGGCEDTPATLAYTGGDGTGQPIAVSVRPRGKWRNEAGNCAVPPLFVFFDAGATAGTPFEGETMLPLTTHCRERPASYEQYVFKEYLAYRIYNALTDGSLRVRLAHISYRDTGRREPRVIERYGFFTEHFESFAAREAMELADAEVFDVAEADPHELATLALFEYLIGNTDWSARAGHNVAHFRDAGGAVRAVAYDFDFSGLVDASYAGPPPQLPIKSVKQRLYRGYCHTGLDWAALFGEFQARRTAIELLVEQTPGLETEPRDEVRDYVADFFAIIDSPEERQERIVDACLPIAGVAADK